MRIRQKRKNGFLLAELTISISILGLLIACIAMSLNGFRRFTDYQMTRQRCIAAAQSQLDSIAATGKPIDENDFKQLWPQMAVTIEHGKDSGQWDGLAEIKVRTESKSFSKTVTIELCRYIREAK